MRVLTYSNSVLTVIKDDLFFSKEYIKPSFINGENFYYEPTLKEMDGVELSDALKAKTLSYINAFPFPVIIHCVNEKGEYIGNKYLEEGEFEVSTQPPTNSQYFCIYDFASSEWKETILVTKDGFFSRTGYCDNEDFMYAFVETVSVDLPIEIQKYDFVTKSFSIHIPYYKNYLLNLQESILINELNNAVGRLAFGEQISWSIQEKESLEYLQNTSSLTLFIDTLLSSRNISGETKEILVNKILTKSENFKLLYASLLGKFHSKQKEIENASTLEALKSIVW